MSVESAIANLRAIWRTERIIANGHLNHLLASAGLKMTAALFAVVGLLLLELAVYFALAQWWSTITVAIVLGLFNLGLAGLLLLAAIKRPLPPELKLASEVQDSAVGALQADARALQAGGFGAPRPPWEGTLAVLLPRLIPLLIRALRRSKAKTPPEED